jgi:hypothetical protein
VGLRSGLLTGVFVAAVMTGLLSGCGSGGSSSSNPNNASKIGAAQSSSESQASIEQKLVAALHLYRENRYGDARTFVVRGGGTCDIEGVHVGDEAKAYEGEPDAVFSPNNAAAVKVTPGPGESEAPCLKAVAVTLHWEQ